MLGAEVSGVYTRQGLMQLVKLNVESEAHAKESDLTKGRMRGAGLQWPLLLANGVTPGCNRVSVLKPRR